MIFKKIKMICAERNISVYKLEKDLGFSPASICKWEKSIPSADKLKAVADYFGVPMEYFMEDTTEGTQESE